MTNSGQLMTLRLLSGAFIGGVAILTVLMVVVAPDTEVPEPWVIAVLLGLVAAAAVLSLAMAGRVPPAGARDDTSSLIAKVQPVHVLRLALMEAPALVAIVLMLLSSEPTWVTVAVAAVPTIVLMLLLVFPHQGVLRRYERALDAGGVRTQFTDRLLGRAP